MNYGSYAPRTYGNPNPYGSAAPKAQPTSSGTNFQRGHVEMPKEPAANNYNQAPAEHNEQHSANTSLPEPGNMPSNYGDDQAQKEFGEPICRFDGKDVRGDIKSHLSMDHNNPLRIHADGKDNQDKSFVTITLTNYGDQAKKANGGKSITASHNLDPWQVRYIRDKRIEVLERAAHAAELAAIRANAQVAGFINGKINAQQPITPQEAAGLYKMLTSPVQMEPFVVCNWEKNNPYRKKPEGEIKWVPVQSLQIKYDMTRRYPWILIVTTFEAPLKESAKGTCSHNSSKARNTKSVTMVLTDEGFYKALDAVLASLDKWEMGAVNGINKERIAHEAEVKARRANHTNHKN